MSEYEDRIRAAWAAKERRLTSETGWLTVVGRHTLIEGPNELPFGTVNLAGGVVRLGARVIRPDEPADAILHEGRTYELVLRGGTFAIRVRDPASEMRRDFAGIDRYAIDSKWRVEARLDRFGVPRTLELPHSLGGIAEYPCPGVLRFEVDGRAFGIEPAVLDDGRLYVLFADETNKSETYPAGRFFYAPALEGDGAVIDFNLAQNPPCAFTPYVTCPLPPPQNRLSIGVTAGEKRPRSH